MDLGNFPGFTGHETKRDILERHPILSHIFVRSGGICPMTWEPELPDLSSYISALIGAEEMGP